MRSHSRSAAIDVFWFGPGRLPRLSWHPQHVKIQTEARKPGFLAENRGNNRLNSKRNIYILRLAYTAVFTATCTRTNLLYFDWKTWDSADLSFTTRIRHNMPSVQNYVILGMSLGFVTFSRAGGYTSLNLGITNGHTGLLSFSTSRWLVIFLGA